MITKLKSKEWNDIGHLAACRRKDHNKDIKLRLQKLFISTQTVKPTIMRFIMNKLPSEEPLGQSLLDEKFPEMSSNDSILRWCLEKVPLF